MNYPKILFVCQQTGTIGEHAIHISFSKLRPAPGLNGTPVQESCSFFLPTGASFSPGADVRRMNRAC